MTCHRETDIFSPSGAQGQIVELDNQLRSGAGERRYESQSTDVDVPLVKGANVTINLIDKQG